METKNISVEYSSDLLYTIISGCDESLYVYAQFLAAICGSLDNLD